MSMILGLVTLGDRNIERLLRDPPLVWRVIAPVDPDAYRQARKSLFLGRLLGRGRAGDDRSGDIALADGEGIATDLDKAWHGIHVLLTGTADAGDPPYDFLLIGGELVGDVDVGYGPARVLTAAQTREVHEALSAVSDESLRQRFNPDEMIAQDIYPDIWARDEEDDDTLGYLMDHVAILRGFLAQAVEQRVGIVLYLS